MTNALYELTTSDLVRWPSSEVMHSLYSGSSATGTAIAGITRQVIPLLFHKLTDESKSLMTSDLSTNPWMPSPICANTIGVRISQRLESFFTPVMDNVVIPPLGMYVGMSLAKAADRPVTFNQQIYVVIASKIQLHVLSTFLSVIKVGAQTAMLAFDAGSWTANMTSRSIDYIQQHLRSCT